MNEEIYRLDYYQMVNRKEPYCDWFDALKDFNACVIIDARLTRLCTGNFGKCDPVGQGVFELKIYYGPGYRIYFSRSGSCDILLLCGGDKSTQSSDILKAQTYWQDYKERHK